MNVKIKKYFIIAAVFFMLLSAALGSLIIYSRKNPEVTPSTEYVLSAWTWTNPYTYTDVTIPPGWQEVTTDQLQETLLALSHQTGRSLVYLIYEETIEPISLDEFVEAMQPANQKELGTEEFKPEIFTDGQEYYYAGGAKYFGDNLVVTKVFIWSDQINHFWRAVSITNMEFKQLEYEADQLINILIESTKQSFAPEDRK